MMLEFDRWSTVPKFGRLPNGGWRQFGSCRICAPDCRWRLTPDDLSGFVTGSAANIPLTAPTAAGVTSWTIGSPGMQLPTVQSKKSISTYTSLRSGFGGSFAPNTWSREASATPSPLRSKPAPPTPETSHGSGRPSPSVSKWQGSVPSFDSTSVVRPSLSTSVPLRGIFPAAAGELLPSMLAPTSFEQGFTMSTFAAFEVNPSPSLTV